MPQIKVEMTFNNLAEVRSFFSNPSETPATQAPKTVAHLSPDPAQSTSPAPAAATILPLTTVVPSAATAPAADDPKALADSVHVAMNDMIKKMPSGAGAAKAREILTKHGLARCRDVKDGAVAQALINDFAAAA